MIKLKRLTACILSLVMLATTFPVMSVMAADSAAEEESQDIYVQYNNIEIDGDFSDWQGVEATEMPIIQSFISGVEPENPLSGNVRYGYDDMYFYVCIEVEDVSHHTVAPDRYWEGDGVQLAFANSGDITFKEMGVVYLEDEDKMQIIGGNLTAAASRKGTTTTYEIAIPWDLKTVVEADATSKVDVPASFTFNAIVNNNNGKTRDHSLEIAHGISTIKDIRLHKTVYVLFPIGEDISYGVVYSEIYEPGVPVEGEVILYNSSDKSKDVTVVSEKVNLDTSVSVPAKQKAVVPFTFVSTSIEKEQVEFKLTEDSKTTVCQKPFSPKCTAALFPAVKEQAESYTKELEALLLQCDEKGISTDYETVNYMVTKHTLDVLRDEANHNYYDPIYDQLSALTKLYNEAKASLEAYLSGEKQPVSVPRYVTSDITTDGYGLKATTYDGTKYEERPVFLYGIGVTIDDAIPSRTLASDIPFLSECGFNYMELAVPMKEFYVDEPTLSRIGNWEIAYGLSGGTQVNLSDEENFSGEYSVKFTREKPAEFNCFRDMRQKINVKPNTTYVVGMKAKTVNAGSWSIYPAGRNSKLGKPQVNIEGGTYDWKDVSVEYTTLDAETTISPTVFVGNTTEALYIDDIYVKEKGTDVNLLEDSSFEAAAARNNKAEELVSNDAFLSQLRAEALEEGWYIDYNGVMELIESLKIAEENNFLVNLMMNLDGMAGYFILAQDPTTTDNKCGFLPFAVDHPHVRKALRIYVQTILHMIKDSKSVYEVKLANEPQVKTSTGTYYIEMWQEYLKNKYTTVENMNAQYGSDYKRFSDVIMPTSIEATPVYHDWIQFNDNVFYRFFEWLFGVAREANPDFKYAVKLLNYVNESHTAYFTWGGSQETLKGLFDINGVDGGTEHYNNGRGQNTIEQIGMWYDFMTSLNKAPVSNTENHIIANSANINLNEKWTPWVTSTIWNSAVHRMGMTSVWHWDNNDYYMPWHDRGYQTYMNPNMTMRPAELAGLGKISLDVNRLSEEITAIQNVEPKAAILYSRTSEYYNANQIPIRMRAYEQLVYNGQKVGYITDTTSEEISKYELVIIPESTNVSAEVLGNVLSYLRNGGRVLIVGDTSLRKNGYDKPHDEAVLSEIYSLATVITEDEIKAELTTQLRQAGMEELVLKDAETGEKIDKTEWSFAEFEDDIVVNILNFEWNNEKTVKIEYQGKEIGSFTELRSGEQYENTLTVSPLEPMLIRFSK